MKYFLYIFTYLLLGASCSSPSRPIDYGTELTATDSICLSIDEHTHYESKSIFQFEENGHEYLWGIERSVFSVIGENSRNALKIKWFSCA